ncbi:hypothetical protein [Phaffia rhodozyma]|uniref:Transmembrane protein n=1 Tax=Phaffia rhodozyma TaxID=264483 RepID=A0A0F7SPS6_PHARH|nr:hypothetical protein [Phaffia rhodozyma]
MPPSLFLLGAFVLLFGSQSLASTSTTPTGNTTCVVDSPRVEWFNNELAETPCRMFEKLYRNCDPTFKMFSTHIGNYTYFAQVSFALFQACRACQWGRTNSGSVAAQNYSSWLGSCSAVSSITITNGSLPSTMAAQTIPPYAFATIDEVTDLWSYASSYVNATAEKSFVAAPVITNTPSIGTIVGAVVGSIAGLIILCVLYVKCIRSRPPRPKKAPRNTFKPLKASASAFYLAEASTKANQPASEEEQQHRRSVRASVINLFSGGVDSRNQLHRKDQEMYSMSPSTHNFHPSFQPSPLSSSALSYSSPIVTNPFADAVEEVAPPNNAYLPNSSETSYQQGSHTRQRSVSKKAFETSTSKDAGVGDSYMHTRQRSTQIHVLGEADEEDEDEHFSHEQRENHQEQREHVESYTTGVHDGHGRARSFGGGGVNGDGMYNVSV